MQEAIWPALPWKIVSSAWTTVFLLVQMAIKRVRQYREGYEPLVDSKNKEVVTALREIAAGKILPEDRRFYTPLEEGASPVLDD